MWWVAEVAAAAVGNGLVRDLKITSLERKKIPERERKRKRERDLHDILAT